MSISIIQVFEKNFKTNTEIISFNASFCNKNNIQYIVLDNTDTDEILENIRNIQKKNKFEYVKKSFASRNENILNILDLVEGQKVLFMYEFDQLPENLPSANFPAESSPIQIFQKLNLNINPKNKTNKFYNNNYVFIFEIQTFREILEKINMDNSFIKNWNIEMFYFYIKQIFSELPKSSTPPQNLSSKKLVQENKYLINCLDYESYNNKEIFLAKKYKKEYLKLKYKYSKNVLEKLKIKLGFF